MQGRSGSECVLRVLIEDNSESFSFSLQPNARHCLFLRRIASDRALWFLIITVLKSHFKQSRIDLKETNDIFPPSSAPPQPVGQSVYDTIIPESLAFRPQGDAVMPLVAHLKKGFDENRPRGWHRNDERRARGLLPVTKAAMQLEGWERELVWMEILILSGSTQASFRHLARAWGRDKGFHMVLAQFICERRGNVERKKRPKGPAGAPKLTHPEEDFMDDILSFEDMDLPIEMLDAIRNSDVDSEHQDSVSHETEHEEVENHNHGGVVHHKEVRQHVETQQGGYIDPLDEHLLMQTQDHVTAEEILSMEHVPQQEVVSNIHAQESAIMATAQN